MKKTCLALLAATALPAFAALDIASVDLEGVKLGMNEEEAVAIVKAYCEEEKNGEYEKDTGSLNGINYDTRACGVNKLGVYSVHFIQLMGAKTVTIGAEQRIVLEKADNKDFIKNWQLVVREKAVQKYGKPALEADNATIMVSSDESRMFQHILCWGGCKTRSSESDKNILETKGQALFIGLKIIGEEATVTRLLIDEAAITAVQKNATKTEAEKAAAKVNL